MREWLLRRLIRRALVTNQLPAFMKILWDEHERVFYEDNRFDRLAHFTESMPDK